MASLAQFIEDGKGTTEQIVCMYMNLVGASSFCSFRFDMHGVCALESSSFIEGFCHDRFGPPLPPRSKPFKMIGPAWPLYVLFQKYMDPHAYDHRYYRLRKRDWKLLT